MGSARCVAAFFLLEFYLASQLLSQRARLADFVVEEQLEDQTLSPVPLLHKLLVSLFCNTQPQHHDDEDNDEDGSRENQRVAVGYLIGVPMREHVIGVKRLQTHQEAQKGERDRKEGLVYRQAVIDVRPEVREGYAKQQINERDDTNTCTWKA